MPRASRTVTFALAVAALSGRPALAIVIDDFTQGATTVPGPGLVAQTGLDPAHTVGGARSIDVGMHSSASVDPAAGLTLASEGTGYFFLTYGAATPLGVDLTADGHDRLLVRLGDIGRGSRGLTIEVYASPNGSRSGTGLFLRDSWDGMLLEFPFAKFSVAPTTVDKITLDVFRNPLDTSVAIKSIGTGVRRLAGDFNYDGVVDNADLAEWTRVNGVNTFDGVRVLGFASADADQNGYVDGQDFLIWQQNVGRTLQSAVPEPTAAALLLSALAALVFRRSRQTP